MKTRFPAVGTILFSRDKGRTATYVIDKYHGLNRSLVHLKATHEGGRSVWKTVERLWLDYDLSRPFVTLRK